MDELSRGQKVMTIVIMTLAVGGMSVWSVLSLPEVLRQAVAYGADQGSLFAWITGYLLLICVIAWLITSAICAAIQRSREVWGKTWFLVSLLVTVVAANSAVIYGPQLLHDSDQKTLNALMDQTQHKMTADIDAYQSELKALGYPGFLQPPSLGAPHGLEHAQEKLKKARAITQRYSSRSEQFFRDTRHQIETLDISEVNKIQALAQFDQRNQRTAEYRIRGWQIQDAMMAEYQAMLDDLAKSKKHWMAMGIELMFQRQEDLDTFNHHLKVTAELAGQASQTRQQLAKASQDAQ